MYDGGNNKKHHLSYAYPAFPNPPGGSHYQNWTTDQIALTWQDAPKTQLHVDVTETTYYRDYRFRIAAKNILYNAISDWNRFYFPCHPDNRGITITIPTPGHYFWAVQQGSGSHDVSFPKWPFTSIHGGCWFLRYGIISNSTYPAEVGQMRYPKSGSINSCMRNNEKCRQTRLLSKSTARTLRFQLGFQPREEGIWVYAPFTVLVFPTQVDYLYEATDSVGSFEVQALNYIFTILTPQDSYPINSFSIRDPAKNNNLHTNYAM
jgi:hypothetical protein